MIYRGRVRGGVIVLDDPEVKLPEGMAVKITPIPDRREKDSSRSGWMASHSSKFPIRPSQVGLASTVMLPFSSMSCRLRCATHIHPGRIYT